MGGLCPPKPPSSAHPGLFHAVILELFMVTFTERSTNNIYPEEVLSFYVRILKILMKIVATSNNVISKQKKTSSKKYLRIIPSRV